MREFKFRVWDETKGNFIYGWENTIYIEAYCFDPKGSCGFSSPQQYTGLKDKHGVEIYEGDVMVYGNSKIIKVVKFSEGVFFNCQRACGPKGVEVVPEIIGDIYKTPELLENKDAN